MLATVGQRIAAAFRATAPDPFVIAVLLTAFTFVLALVTTDTTPVQLIDDWADPSNGIWKFLGFSMQMCLILVTGHALAAAGPVALVLRKLADLPQTGAQAAALVAFVAASLGTLNWGLGLIAGALMARDVGRSLSRRNIPYHYPVLVAAGYVGLMVWHGGFSGTAPLKVSTAAQIADVLPPDVHLDPIPITRTILSPMNLVITGGMVVLVPVIFAMLMPKSGESAPSTPAPGDGADETDRTPIIPRILEETPIVNLLLAAMIAVWAWRYYFPAEGASGIRTLTPNSVNLTMLMLGLLLHRSPRSFLSAVEDGARGCAGIIIQFPLYAGIMGMMHASGLTAELASLLGRGSPTTLPLTTCVSAGVVNLFVPSGGGQWGVQGPIVIQSALDAGVPMPKMVMALAYGDELTNMLQPFWALPLLAITGAKARDIVGYTAIAMAFGFVWTLGWLLVF
ncbi:MAG TPA: short-chain fatty acid transporter [Phycisphaerales bacterium]|nr:short-chain fatty acid transporter [Phycisphaerales bacterium]